MIWSRRLSVLPWLTAVLVGLALRQFPELVPALVKYPDTLTLPVQSLLNSAMDLAVDGTAWFFRAVSWLMEWPVKGAQSALQHTPWSVTTAAFALIGYRAGGWKLACFTAFAFLYMAVIGYWSESMNSLALVSISVPLAILVGFTLGIWGFYSNRAYRVLMPSLDVLQTIPAFSYLLLILLLFGFGTTVGLIASILFSFPPMVRNTILGLRGVDETIIESARMSGATEFQSFRLVRLPAAKRQILLGINQVTMASLSMVIVASIIGGTSDIGWEVLSTMRKAQFGESLLAGTVIALMAMVLDRVTVGWATGGRPAAGSSTRILIAGGLVGSVLLVLSFIVPALMDYPEALVFFPADIFNDALSTVTVKFNGFFEAIKSVAFFYLMLPLKIGFQQAVSPFTWGFSVTPAMAWIYAAAIALAAGVSWRAGRVGGAISILVCGYLLAIGLTNVPWIVLAVLLILSAWRAGGMKIALGMTMGILFLLVSGLWDKAILSLYLCGAAVVLSFVVGTAIGIVASESDRVSAAIRPINDTLQTMPLFVILIPFVMIFKIGELTALLAIMAYATVPAIRYAEHGLRNLPEDVLEAGRMLGSTRWQILFLIKLPLALPSLMLGLNQTIMYGISMLVIAALVGTNGLGQIVYIGLGDGDFGVGMTAGVGMAIIAILADRMTQAYRAKLIVGHIS